MEPSRIPHKTCARKYFQIAEEICVCDFPKYCMNAWYFPPSLVCMCVKTSYDVFSRKIQTICAISLLFRHIMWIFIHIAYAIEICVKNILHIFCCVAKLFVKRQLEILWGCEICEQFSSCIFRCSCACENVCLFLTKKSFCCRVALSHIFPIRPIVSGINTLQLLSKTYEIKAHAKAESCNISEAAAGTREHVFKYRWRRRWLCVSRAYVASLDRHLCRCDMRIMRCPFIFASCSIHLFRLKCVSQPRFDNTFLKHSSRVKKCKTSYINVHAIRLVVQIVSKKTPCVNMMDFSTTCLFCHSVIW